MDWNGLYIWDTQFTYVRGSQTFSCHFPKEVPPPAHFSRGQWVPVGRHEALNGKNFQSFFDAILIS